jgi:hypothetical protein
MSKKSKSMVLGYTRAGHAVMLPTRNADDVEKLVGWTRGDHLDASRILTEHGERERDTEVGSWCESWARSHRTIGRAPRRARIRGAAEIRVRLKGSR